MPSSSSLSHFTRAGLLASLAFCLWFPLERAAAGLNYDVRVNGGKIAFVTGVGQVITIDLYAQVTGAAGNDSVEGFQDGFGSMISSTGGNILGDLSSSLLAPFNAPGAQLGTRQSLDGDGDLDVGSNATVHSSDFFFARAASMQTIQTTTAGTPIANGTEFKIATFSFTVTSVSSFADFSPISINFQVPLFSNNLDIEALWQQDGLAMSSNGLNGGTQPTVGAAVMISIPEPSSLGLLALAASGLLARRRRRV